MILLYLHAPLTPSGIFFCLYAILFYRFVATNDLHSFKF